jgi:calcineurin-like phosphoesterase family protein
MRDLFYKNIRQEAKNDQILFWGCLHWHHNPSWDLPIWKRRGFNSVQEHDETLVKNWNSKATDKTIGFLLGDTMFGMGGKDEFMSLMRQLKFHRLFVMSGNHHAGFKQAFDEIDSNTLYVDGNYSKEVIFVPNYLEAYINGQPIVMCHYPVLSWNGAGKGSWMLFSHVHGSLGNSELGRMYLKNGGYNLEVSVEATKFPLTYGEIGVIMKNKSKFKTDHHDDTASTPFS